MGRNMKSNGKHSANSDYSLILTDEDKAKGFSVMARGGSVMLLKCGKAGRLVFYCHLCGDDGGHGGTRESLRGNQKINEQEKRMTQ